MAENTAGATGTTDGTGKAGEATGAADTGGTNTGASEKPGADGRAGTGDVAQDGKAADGTTTTAASSDDGSKAGEAEAKPKAPEKYEFKVPEGGRITASAIARVEEIARANDWTLEEAQLELDALDTTIAATIKETSEAFLEATKADPELGGDHYEPTLKAVKTAMDRLAPKGSKSGDAFRKLLDETGYGNHPEVVRIFAKLGKQMQEDRPGGDNGGGNQPKDAAETLYGKTS